MVDIVTPSPQPPQSVVAVLVLLFTVYYAKQFYDWAVAKFS